MSTSAKGGGCELPGFPNHRNRERVWFVRRNGLTSGFPSRETGVFEHICTVTLLVLFSRVVFASYARSSCVQLTMSGWIDAKVNSTVLVMCTVMLFIFIGEEVCHPAVAYMIEQCIADAGDSVSHPRKSGSSEMYICL